jgi:hypothetical protein
MCTLIPSRAHLPLTVFSESWPRFVDPTNDVSGLSKYLRALGVLFDPAFSKAQSATPASQCWAYAHAVLPTVPVLSILPPPSPLPSLLHML